MNIRINLKNKMNKLKEKFYNNIKGESKMNNSYTIIIHKEENPKGYWAECRNLKGCFAQAKTIEEVKKLMKEAIIIKLKENEETVSTENIDIVLSYA